MNMNLQFAINILIILVFSGAFLLLPLRGKTKKAGMIFISLCVAAEIFVCNFHSFHLWFRDYEKENLSLENAVIDTESLNNVNSTTITFSNINKKIGTVYIDCALPELRYFDNNTISTKGTPYVNVRIDAKDETYSANYRYGTANGTIIKNDHRSKTIVLNMSGNVSELRINLTSEEGYFFSVNEVRINSPVPFNLSALRVFLGFFLLFGIYLLTNSCLLRQSIEDEKKLYARAVYVITAIMLVTAVLITALYNLDNSNIAFNKLFQESGNQISQELVDAFEKGQVSLLDTPHDSLLSLDNPYDWGERSNKGIGYKWDHLLFEGKYYSYYGIAPVILLFLPFHLLTGYYFPTPEAVLIFGMIGIAFLSMLFYEFTKKLFPKLPLNVAIASLIVIQTSSSVWYCFASPLFYEIAQSSGFAFTCAGFYFLLRSNVITEERIMKRHLILSSFCLSCAVLCRPTLAVYCVAALLFIAAGFFKNRKEAKENNKKLVTSCALYLTSALACFVIIGGCQMVYNYVRFGSFFDFGIQYSLTINDFTKAEYHTDFVSIGFWNYLFAAPYIKPEFPFVFSNFSSLDTNGYYFIANRNAIGLFYRALPSLGLFFAPFAFKFADKKKRIVPSILLLSVCIICPLIIIFSIWESGYGVRYAADFAWQMILGGMVVIYYLVSHFKLYKNKFAENTVILFFVYSAVISTVYNSALMYDYLNKAGYLQSTFMSFERLFEFWV